MSMRMLVAALAIGGSAMAQANPSLTIYNGNFAVVRSPLELALEKGINQVQYHDITRQLEADSVVLRSNDSKVDIRILEQNYLANTANETLLLHHFEGKTIDFEIIRDQKPVIVPGRIVRSGYDTGGDTTPIIELEGKTRFGLPGIPLFPPLQDDTLLKPALQWQLESSTKGNTPLELAYITAGLSWKSDYNIIAREGSDDVQINGWVTFKNDSGKDFVDATVKLMAGDVNKLAEAGPERAYAANVLMKASAPAVKEKDFDEFHLYTLENKVNLHQGESKQVEFISASKVKASKIYIYDGAASQPQQRFYVGDYRNDPDYGTQSNSKVWVMREFVNSAKNKLGIPLPKGRVRFYQQDSDQQLEFIGENSIDHTPKDETVRLYTGNAFDVVGKRERIDVQMNTTANRISETFQITVKNRKKESVKVRVVEHMSRWHQWSLEKASDESTKRDASTIEFNVPLQPNDEKVITYTVNYTW